LLPSSSVQFTARPVRSKISIRANNLSVVIRNMPVMDGDSETVSEVAAAGALEYCQ